MLSSAARIGAEEAKAPSETNLLRFFSGAFHELQLFDADW